MIIRIFKLVLPLLILFSNLFFVQNIFSAGDINCENRYVTLVNPIRSRELWLDKSLKPLQNQYELVKYYQLPATWLIQYDVLFDNELIKTIKDFNNQQEVGIFLEISEKLAVSSTVIYPVLTPWYSPKAVFLSGYSQSERRQMVDKIFGDFNHYFGYFPSSVGAWWIDSYSLQYMKKKYNIKTAMIVADQKTTDNYGVWGQWWGVPYYPSKANILVPASTLDNKLKVVVIQWAQRDFLLANKAGPEYSNYSMQANDYIRQGKNTAYFEDLISQYLDCQNPLGQITVGLETGLESVGYLPEYENQLKALKKINGLKPVTMNDFTMQFEKVYPDLQSKVTLGFPNLIWKMDANSRSNYKFEENISYNPNVSFSDYFIKDNSLFLYRNLTSIKMDQKPKLWFPWYMLLIIFSAISAYFLKKFRLWIIAILFTGGAYGLIFKSHIQYGWIVYYGPVFSNIEFIQISLIILSLLLIWLISKYNKLKIFKNPLVLWLIPLSFGIDIVLQSLRYSFISGKYYFGLLLNTFWFLGFSFQPPLNINFINKDFPNIQASALLKLDFEKIWSNFWLAVIVYPTAHILVAVILGIIFIFLTKRLQYLILLILIVLFIFQIINIFQHDPRAVIPCV